MRKKVFFVVFIGLSCLLYAEDARVVPLDMYLIIDGSSSFQASKNEAIAWVNANVVDRLLMEGDKISVWKAGDSFELIFSGGISPSGGKTELKDKLASLSTDGETADFSGALNEAASGVSGTPRSRLSYTMLLTASAEGMERALSGDSRPLFKWFRSDKFQRWQAFIVGTDIAAKAREAAESYMRSL